MNTLLNILYVLAVLYIIGFTVSVLGNELLKLNNKILDFIRVQKNAKVCIIELTMYVFIATPAFLLNTVAEVQSAIIGITGWIMFAVLKVKEYRETRTMDY